MSDQKQSGWRRTSDLTHMSRDRDRDRGRGGSSSSGDWSSYRRYSGECKYFTTKGSCTKGEKCTFRHDMEKRQAFLDMQKQEREQERELERQRRRETGMDAEPIDELEVSASGWVTHPTNTNRDRSDNWSTDDIDRHRAMMEDAKYKNIYIEPKWDPVNTDNVRVSYTENELHYTDTFNISNRTATDPNNIQQTAKALQQAAKALGYKLSTLGDQHDPNIMQAYRIKLTPIVTTTTTTTTATTTPSSDMKSDPYQGVAECEWALSLSYDVTYWFRYILPELAKRNSDSDSSTATSTSTSTSVSTSTSISTSISTSTSTPSLVTESNRQAFVRKHARAFVNQHKSSSRYVAINQLESVHVIESPEDYCGQSCDCSYMSRGCYKKHSRIVCPQYVPRNGFTNSTRCGWYASTNLLLRQERDWLLTCRPENIRDILMLPRPPVHKANIALAQDNEFWVKVIQQAHDLHAILNDRRRFSVGTISLNFGKWESGISKDEYAVSCHGHIHFLLTEAAMKDLSHPTLKNKLGDPPNYPAADAIILEREWLNAVETADLSQRMANIETDMKSIMTMLSTILANQNKTTQQ